MKIAITKDEYLALASKYDDDLDVQKLVIFTFEGTKRAYFSQGFRLGVTFGLLMATAIAAIVSIIN